MNNVTQILQHWSLGDSMATPIESPSQSTWDIDGKYILKEISRFSNADEFKRGMQFSSLLNAQNIPMAVFIPSDNGQLTSPDGLYCLMSKLPGKHVDFYCEPNLAIEMGRELSRLHSALMNIEPQITCHDNDLLVDWDKWIKPGLDGFVSSDIVEAVDAVFRKLYPNLPRQLIHRDVHLHNVLFYDGRLTGWLDFDISQRNARIFDIAYLLGGLLYDKQKDSVIVGLWHTIYNNLLSGYDEISILTNDERDALPVLMIVIQFLFVCFWNGRDNAEQRDASLELAIWLYNEYMGE